MVLNKENNPEHSCSIDNNDVGVGEDKISNLPDALIYHILSFLPTKCVMSTCILSKRWRYVPDCISTLDFREWQAPYVNEEETRLKTQQFMNFLDRVLYLHEKPNIQKFCLTLNRFSDESRVNMWISSVLKRKVKELFVSRCFLLRCIRSRVRTSLIFPLSFFTCDSLRVLELEWVRFKVPNTVSFPSLKLLRLSSVEFVDEISFEKLISNCPILENCSMVGFYYMPKVLCTANVSLKNLHIGINIDTESIVKISAPNLLTISYASEVPADFVFDSSPSLVEADIDTYCDKSYTFETSVVIKLFAKLSNVKLLKIFGDFFMVLSEGEILLTDSPAFENLRHLEGISLPGKNVNVYWTDKEDDVYCTDEEDDVYCTDEEDDDF